MTDEKNIGRWTYLVDSFVGVKDIQNNVILYGNLISTNYEMSKFLPYTSSRSTHLKEDLELVNMGKPCGIKDEAIGGMEPIPKEYLDGLLKSIEEINKERLDKKEVEKLADKLNKLKLELDIKTLRSKKSK